MADTNPTVPPVVNPTEPPGGVNPNPPQGDTTVPYARFKEVNDRLKELRDAEEARQVAEKKAKDDQLLKDREFETLLKTREDELRAERDKSKALQEKADQFDATQKQIREQALGKIKDERMRGIAAELSTAKLLEFVETQNVNQPPFTGTGAPGAGDKAGDLAIKPGESASDYANRMAKRKRTGA